MKPGSCPGSWSSVAITTYPWLRNLYIHWKRKFIWLKILKFWGNPGCDIGICLASGPVKIFLLRFSQGKIIQNVSTWVLFIFIYVLCLCVGLCMYVCVHVYVHMSACVGGGQRSMFSIVLNFFRQIGNWTWSLLFQLVLLASKLKGFFCLLVLPCARMLRPAFYWERGWESKFRSLCSCASTLLT